MEFENLLKLIDSVSESNLTGFHYEENGVKIKLSKNGGKVTVVEGEPTYFAQPAIPNMASIAPQAAMATPEATMEASNITSVADDNISGNIVKSPLVGTFYAAPSEDSESFVSLGDTVKKGQVMAIIEAMKLMNEIECEFSGKVVEIYVENGQAVEYGQPLFRVE